MIQPEKQEPIKESRKLFEVILQPDGKITFTRFTNHIGTLDYIANTILYEIFELRAEEKTKKEITDMPKIIPGLRKFLNRRHG